MYGIGIAYVMTTAISLRYLLLMMFFSHCNEILGPIVSLSCKLSHFVSSFINSEKFYVCLLLIQSDSEVKLLSHGRASGFMYIWRYFVYADIWSSPDCCVTNTRFP